MYPLSYWAVILKGRERNPTKRPLIKSQKRGGCPASSPHHVEVGYIADRPVCEEPGHGVHRCYVFGGRTPNQRLRTAIMHRLCFVCLRSGHITRHCPNLKRCQVPDCGRFHASILHLADWQEYRRGSNQSYRGGDKKPRRSTNTEKAGNRGGRWQHRGASRSGSQRTQSRRWGPALPENRVFVPAPTRPGKRQVTASPRNRVTRGARPRATEKSTTDREAKTFHAQGSDGPWRRTSTA